MVSHEGRLHEGYVRLGLLGGPPDMTTSAVAVALGVILPVLSHQGSCDASPHNRSACGEGGLCSAWGQRVHVFHTVSWDTHKTHITVIRSIIGHYTTLLGH